VSDRPTYDVPWLTRRAHRWYAKHTYGAKDIASDLLDLKREAGVSISVALPALNEANTVGPICRSIVDHLTGPAGLVDELVVLDGGSADDTVAVARAAGASVVDARGLIPHVPPVKGKGESLWRSLSILTGDIICWIDADITNFEPHFVSRLLAPLLMDPSCMFVKAFYRRPIAYGEVTLPTGGGRVTELLARPLLNALFPELSGVVQPLSGEYAGRRDVSKQDSLSTCSTRWASTASPRLISACARTATGRSTSYRPWRTRSRKRSCGARKSGDVSKLRTITRCIRW